MLSFMRHFAQIKGHDAVAAVTKAIIARDPVGASAADLRVMEEDLDKAGTTIAALRSDVASGQKEYDAINHQYGELMSAAEVLQKRIAAAEGDKKVALEKSLGNLVSKIEPMVQQLDRRKHDMEQTTALLNEAESAYQEKAAALTTAKQDLEAARHDLKHAQIEEERAHQRADQAAVVAGLRTSNATGLNTALSVLQQSAAEARERATAAGMKAEALGTAHGQDENVASAIAEARGQSQPDKSLTERLAALKR